MEEKVVEKPNYFLLTIVIVLLLIILALLVYFMRFRTSIAPSASTQYSDRQVSIVNSYLFSSPVRAATGGDLIRVTVFLLDDYGVGVFDKKVELIVDQNLKVIPVQERSDETGKVIFDISSDIKGIYYIEAMSDRVSLGRAKLIFD